LVLSPIGIAVCCNDNILDVLTNKPAKMRCNEVKRKSTTGTMKLKEAANDNTKSINAPYKPRSTTKSALIHSKKTIAGGASKRSVGHFISRSLTKSHEVEVRIYEKYFNFFGSCSPRRPHPRRRPHPTPPRVQQPRVIQSRVIQSGGHPEQGVIQSPEEEQ
jgi:hypothetical protein